MSFNPIQTIKGHPVAIGAVVIGGGFVFLMLSGAFGGGNSGTVSSSGVSDAQVAAGVQKDIATIQSQTALGAANIAANAQGNDNALQLAIAQIAGTIQSKTLEVQQALGLKSIDAQVMLGTTQSNNELEAMKYSTQAQSDFIGSILSAVKTNTSSGGSSSGSGGSPPVASTGFDYYNTANNKAPLLQGFDAHIANDIDKGNISVVSNGSGGAVVTIPGEGSFVSYNPYDVRWATQYDPGTYTESGGAYTGL